MLKNVLTSPGLFVILNYTINIRGYTMKIVFDEAESVHVNDIDDTFFIIAKKDNGVPLILFTNNGKYFFCYDKFISHRLNDNSPDYFTNLHAMLKAYHREGYRFWASESYSEFREKMVKVYSGDSLDCF